MNIAGIEVEDMDFDEVLEATDVEMDDPRLEQLSPETKLVIAKCYGGDYDLALEHAQYKDLMLIDPPFWVHEMVQPRSPNTVSKMYPSWRQASARKH